MNAPPMTLSASTHDERREHVRLDVARPCKVFRPGPNRFEAAQTTNVSVGGALIEVISSRPISAGEMIDVGVAWSSQAVLRSGSLVRGRVVRVSNAGPGRQGVAVRFVSRGAEAMAAA